MWRQICPFALLHGPAVYWSEGPPSHRKKFNVSSGKSPVSIGKSAADADTPQGFGVPQPVGNRGLKTQLVDAIVQKDSHTQTCLLGFIYKK